MAEIKIEKKKPIWPWILAALAVLLVLFLIFSDTGDDDVDDMETVTETEAIDTTYTETTTMTNNSVTEYLTFVNTDSEDRMGLSHNYTETALEMLTTAVEDQAEEANVNIDEELKKVNSVADYITEDAYATQHADSIKVAFQNIAGSIEKIQNSEDFNKNVDVQGLKNHADAVKGKELTLNQKDDVRGFFEKAANVLREMDDNRERNMAGMQNNNTGTTTETTY